MRPKSATRKSKPKPQGNYIDTFVKQMFGRVLVFVDFLLHYADIGQQTTAMKPLLLQQFGMKTILQIIVILWASTCLTASGQTQGNEWMSLFNGKDLSGWTVACQKQDSEKVFWTVEDGAILCNSIGKTDHDYVWLMTDREFQDFELRLKFQVYTDSPGNSGLQFRSRYDKADNGGWLNGPQVDIHPPKAQSWRTGLIYDETRGEQRWVFPSLKNSEMPGEHEPKEHVMKYADDGNGWNDLTLICERMKIKTIVNGIVRTDWDATGVFDNESHRKHNVGRKGYFALQLHSGDELRIKFKDIQIREIKD